MSAALDGWYYDPLHGHCLRRIERAPTASTYRIYGVFGADERPRTGAPWVAIAVVQAPNRLLVDFAGKPGKRPRFLRATVGRRRIDWEDGNVWHKLYVHPPSQLCGT